VAYAREPRSPDWVLDLWHPMEKAQFPDYFAKRSQLKKEYIEHYVKKYGITKYNPEEEGHVHELDEHHDNHDDHHHKH
jgi:NADH dehydrogenase (ubiquinone) 1 beta subcomplex subunit 9